VETNRVNKRSAHDHRLSSVQLEAEEDSAHAVFEEGVRWERDAEQL
jgi:hypothetical protein